VPHDLHALRSLYEEVDSQLGGWSCDASTDCCHFGRTGREPHLHGNEWALLERAIATRGGRRAVTGARGRLPVLAERRCPLLDGDGRCSVYEARPFGCRTYFCERARGPERRLPRAAIAELGRRVAALAERDDPRAGGPRTLTSWLEA
jgi:Fe-S-cluster containining protein